MSYQAGERVVLKYGVVEYVVTVVKADAESGQAIVQIGDPATRAPTQVALHQIRSLPYGSQLPLGILG